MGIVSTGTTTINNETKKCPKKHRSDDETVNNTAVGESDS